MLDYMERVGLTSNSGREYELTPKGRDILVDIHELMDDLQLDPSKFIDNIEEAIP